MCCAAERAAHRNHVNCLAKMTDAERREWAQSKVYLDSWQFPAPSPDVRTLCTTASPPESTSGSALESPSASSPAYDAVRAPCRRACRPLARPEPCEEHPPLRSSEYPGTPRGREDRNPDVGPFDDQISLPPEKWWWTDPTPAESDSVKSARRRGPLSRALNVTRRGSRPAESKDKAVEEEEDAVEGQPEQGAKRESGRSARRWRNMVVECRNAYGFYVRAPQRVPWQSEVLTTGQKVVQRFMHYEEPAGTRERITL